MFSTIVGTVDVRIAIDDQHCSIDRGCSNAENRQCDESMLASNRTHPSNYRLRHGAGVTLDITIVDQVWQSLYNKK
jgi:hypothetical protein